VTRFSSTPMPLRPSAESGWVVGRDGVRERAPALFVSVASERARIFPSFVRVECDDEHTPDVLTRSN